ncbi:MAG: ABC transporter substrate-binding protein [Cyanobacteria bacterium P01_H01_bin.58]
MKRRAFLGTTAASAASLSATVTQAQTSASPTNLSQPSIRWRMATSWPKSLSILFGSVSLFCQRISEMTEGRFVITPYASDEIVPALQVMDAVADGTVECGHTLGYYYTDKSLALAFGTTVPFGLTAQQQLAWLMEGGGLPLLQKLYADFGIIQFPLGSTGAQMGGWFRQPVETLADLQGLKMRIPGLGGKVLARLGVNVQVLAGSEIFEHLESGELDAAEWAGPYDDEQLGLNRVTAYYYYPGWWEPGTTYEVQINRQEWERLPSSYQEAFRGAALEGHMSMMAEYDNANSSALERLILGGTQLRAYDPSILEAARQAAIDLYEEHSAADSRFRDIYVAWKQFRSQVYAWEQLGTLPLIEMDTY